VVRAGMWSSASPRVPAACWAASSRRRVTCSGCATRRLPRRGRGGRGCAGARCRQRRRRPRRIRRYVWCVRSGAGRVPSRVLHRSCRGRRCSSAAANAVHPCACHEFPPTDLWKWSRTASASFLRAASPTGPHCRKLRTWCPRGATFSPRRNDRSAAANCHSSTSTDPAACCSRTDPRWGHEALPHSRIASHTSGHSQPTVSKYGWIHSRRHSSKAYQVIS